jgi:UDP-N-acetyl-D-glucosamine dehydrogenase
MDMAVPASTASTAAVSIAPDGEQLTLPQAAEYAEERQRLEALVTEQRALGREVVVVMGVGFVGAVMAGVVADSLDRRTCQPGKFVIAMQRPSPRSYWKIPCLNRGHAPVEAEDPEVAPLIRRTVLEKRTLTATFTYDALALADVVVVDVQCDYVKDALGDLCHGHADIAALEQSFQVIGERIRPDCLVLIETTVPPGTTEHIAYPLIQREFEARGLAAEPLLAHSYERVMPGRHYVASVRDFWRVCSGASERARERVVAFLSDVLNVEQYPLTVLDRPLESETCKVIENSYRATLLAFMDEWSLFAERAGIDIVKIIEAIKVRPTHNNILFPGPGVGGYCLPKDGALGMWAYAKILGFGEERLPVTTAAININDTRALHVSDLVVEALEDMGRVVDGAPVLLCGASYREDVGDTRQSGSELIARKLVELGAALRVHDPYVAHWYELENQESYPAVGQSRSRFFAKQASLTGCRVEKDLGASLRGTAAVILAVRHAAYLRLDPAWVVAQAGGPVAVVDCFGILSDAEIVRYGELGCAVRGLGRGHVSRLLESAQRRERPDIRKS